MCVQERSLLTAASKSVSENADQRGYQHALVLSLSLSLPPVLDPSLPSPQTKTCFGFCYSFCSLSLSRSLFFPTQTIDQFLQQVFPAQTTVSWIQTSPHNKNIFTHTFSLSLSQSYVSLLSSPIAPTWSEDPINPLSLLSLSLLLFLCLQTTKGTVVLGGSGPCAGFCSFVLLCVCVCVCVCV